MTPQHGATLDLRFSLRERAGSVHVEVWPNDDPEDLGHALVAVGYDVAAFRGFPVIEARISYDGHGPRGWMGWLQVIERHDDDGQVVADVDVAGLMGDESPLYTFGFLPTFCDFPANPDHPDGDWVAHTFLVAVPDVVRTRVLMPVVAFRWGYRLVGGRPVGLFAPAELPLGTWDHHRALLDREYPGWRFLSVAAT
ncbi:MAG: hypothetical protein QOI06_2143 [Nocardioidaceae bacterium]|nr:hypothetical protein [Nocardioidaceae bacterium]